MSSNAFISAAARLAVAPIFVFFTFEAGLAHADGVVASATGGFQVTYSGGERTIEFAAIRDGQNNSRGQGQLFNHTSGTKLHFSIDCLHVDGNVATISGTWSRDSFPDFPYFYLQVADNGEGNQATDYVSPLFASVESLPCTSDETDAAIPIDGGNIQVR